MYLESGKYRFVIRQNLSYFLLAYITNITVEAFKRIEAMIRKKCQFLKPLYHWFSTDRVMAKNKQTAKCK